MREEILTKYFIEQLRENKLSVKKIDSEGFYHIGFNGMELTVFPENAIKDSLRAKNKKPITDLIKTILAIDFSPRSWNEVKDKIFPSLENATLDIGNSPSYRLTEQAKVCYGVYDENKYSFVSESDINIWKISEEELKHAARENLNLLFRQTEIKKLDVEEHGLYFFNTNFELRSSFLLSGDFYQKYSKEFHSRIMAIFPARDYCHFFSEEEWDYFSKRIGKIVSEEHDASGHPISKEVVIVAKDGFEVVGTY